MGFPWYIDPSWGAGAADILARLAVINAKAACLLIVCLILLRLWRGSAANRHLLMTAALGAAFVLPIAGYVVPVIPIEVQVQAAAATAVSAGETVVTPVTTEASAFTLDHALVIFLFVYVSVAALLGLKVLLGNLCVWRLVSKARPVTSSQWCERLQQLSTRTGVAKTVLIKHSTQIHSPMTWGKRRPVILLPSAALQWPEHWVHSTLLHELAHIRRGDWWVQQWARCVCAVYWLNPFCWLALNRLAAYAELACDDMAVNAGVKPSHYAKVLLRIAACGGAAEAPAAALSMAKTYRRSQLGRRITTILNPLAGHVPNSRRRVMLTAAVVAGLLVPLAGLRTVYVAVAPPPKESPVQTTARQTASASDIEVEATATRAVALYNPLTPDDIRQRALGEIRQQLTQLARNSVNVAPPPQSEPSTSEQQVANTSAATAPAPAGKASPQLAKQSTAALDDPATSMEQEQAVSTEASPEADVPTAAELAAINATVAAAANPELEPTETVPQNPFQRLLAMHRERDNSQGSTRAASKDTAVALEQLSRERLVMPVYPRRARSRGIEGEVLVRYSIDQNGQVYNPEVIDADPRGVFDTNVLRAVKRFVFNPHEVDGRPVAVESVEERFVFVLES